MMKDKTALVIGIGAPKKPMDEGMDESSMNELCVPGAAIATDSDGGSVAPAVGDPVDFSVAGTVSRVEGDNVYVKIEKANGQPVEGSKYEEDSESPDQEDAEANGLRDQAKKEDDEMPY